MSHVWGWSRCSPERREQRAPGSGPESTTEPDGVDAQQRTLRYQHRAQGGRMGSRKSLQPEKTLCRALLLGLASRITASDTAGSVRPTHLPPLLLRPRGPHRRKTAGRRKAETRRAGIRQSTESQAASEEPKASSMAIGLVRKAPEDENIPSCEIDRPGDPGSPNHIRLGTVPRSRGDLVHPLVTGDTGPPHGLRARIERSRCGTRGTREPMAAVSWPGNAGWVDAAAAKARRANAVCSGHQARATSEQFPDLST